MLLVWYQSGSVLSYSLVARDPLPNNHSLSNGVVSLVTRGWLSISDYLGLLLKAEVVLRGKNPGAKLYGMGY